MAQRTVTRAMRLAADQLISYSPRWARGVRHADGLRFVLFTSKSDAGVVYFTSTAGCTCPGFRNRGTCCHHIAVAEDAARQQQPAAPAPRLRYEDIFKCCRDCGDLADGLDGRCSKCASDAEWEARRATRTAA